MVTIGKYFVFDKKKEWMKEFLAEFLGTFLLVFMGNSGIAEAVLTENKAGNAVTIYLGYGIGLLLGVVVAAGVSGAHLNPAVTITAVIVKKFELAKVPHYIVAQYLGGFVAACGTYILYIDSFGHFHNIHGINKTTAAIFATYPKDHLSAVGCFIDQILGSMILIIAIYAITDSRNANVPSHLAPLYISLTLIGIGCSIGINQGYAINPARDLAPRFFTYLACWGSEVFSARTYWYVPIIGPHVGAILGGVVYVYFVEKMRNVSDANDLDLEGVGKKPETSEDSNHNSYYFKSEIDSGRETKKESYSCHL